jgi:uncharacterized protein YkwD
MRGWLLLVLCAACGGDGGGTTGTTGTSSDPAVQHNLDVLNMYRSQNNAPALVLSGALNQFADTGSQQLAAGGGAHGHFMAASNDGSIWKSGFCGGAGENQAPGWPLNPDENGTIDAILKAMMDEGPGGGHHDNIINSNYRSVGIGLVVQGGLYLTNDFSNACN